MSRRFEVGPEDYAEFRSAVKALVREGRLDLAKDKTLQQPDRLGARSSGSSSGRPRGSGSSGRTSRRRRPTRSSSRAKAGRDASSGDEVVVKITKRPKGPGMSPEGRIVQVLARASGVFVGTYFERGGAGFVKIDGTTFNDPVYVGDPGAKGAKPGDKVALEMVRYPTPVSWKAKG